MMQDVEADMDTVVREVQRRLNNAYSNQVHSRPFLTISVVPAHCRGLNDSSYTPYYVSIGPYHMDSSQLRREAEKECCLHELLGLQQDPTRRPSLNSLVNIVQQLVVEHRIREGYGLSSEKVNGLVEMLLFDGGYLVANYGDPVNRRTRPQRGGQPLPSLEGTASGHVRGASVRPLQGAGGGVHGTSSSNSSTVSSSSSRSIQLQPMRPAEPWPDENANLDVLVRDTWYLLENQIPFIVVEKMYELTTGRPETDVREAFSGYAQGLLQSKSYISTGASFLPPQPQHLLHLLHSFFKPIAQDGARGQVGSTTARMGPWRRATEYVAHSNARFIGRRLDDSSTDDNARSVLDVRIDGGTVHVPRLNIDGDTRTILLNLMALERQHPSLGTHVTAYCLFISQIACKADDVELLVRHGVLQHYLGAPENVAACFADLCSGVILDTDDIQKNYLNPMWHDLEKRYRNPGHNFCSWLRLNYWSCRNATVIIGLIVGSILFASEVVSAVFQALSYYHQVKASSSSGHG